MLPIETNTLEFVWPWCFFLWFLPFIVRYFIPRDNYVMAIRVPFFDRINDLPKTALIEDKNIKSMFLSLFIWITRIQS